MPEPNKKSGCVEYNVRFLQVNEPLISYHLLGPWARCFSVRPFSVRVYRRNQTKDIYHIILLGEL